MTTLAGLAAAAAQGHLPSSPQQIASQQATVGTTQQQQQQQQVSQTTAISQQPQQQPTQMVAVTAAGQIVGLASSQPQTPQTTTALLINPVANPSPSTQVMTVQQPQPTSQYCQVMQGGPALTVVKQEPGVQQQQLVTQTVLTPQQQSQSVRLEATTPQIATHQVLQYTPLPQHSSPVLVNSTTGHIIGQMAPVNSSNALNLGSVQVAGQQQSFMPFAFGHHQPNVIHTLQPPPSLLQPNVVHIVQPVDPRIVAPEADLNPQSQTTHLSIKAQPNPGAASFQQRVRQIMNEQRMLLQSNQQQPQHHSSQREAPKSIKEQLSAMKSPPVISTPLNISPSKTVDQLSPVPPNRSPQQSTSDDCRSPKAPSEDTTFPDNDSFTSLPSGDEEGDHKSYGVDVSTQHDAEEEQRKSNPSSPNQEPESTTHSPDSGDGQKQDTIKQTMSVEGGGPRIVDGVNLDEVREFARMFKLKRIHLGLTQTQVGLSLSKSEGPSYSQSAICRFEKLEITPKSALKIMPVLKDWLAEAEKKYQDGELNLSEAIGVDTNKKRKRRTTFTPQAIEALNKYFQEVSTHPESHEMSQLAEEMGYEKEVVRVWFCNKRQALKNTLKKMRQESENTINQTCSGGVSVNPNDYLDQSSNTSGSHGGDDGSL